MSLKSRVNSMERKLGQSQEPDIVWINTFFEGKSGETERAIRKAVVVYGFGDCDYFEPDEGESQEDFTKRVKAASKARRSS